MVEEAGAKLGKRIGLGFEIETDGKGRCLDRFMCIRVLKNVIKPLWKVTRLGSNFDIKSVDFKYHCLPNFYFICGKIDHIQRECMEEKANILRKNQTF